MRKSMKQKVALFLSVAMAVTSVDSSVLVTAADVIETVSEDTQQEEATVEEAEVQQEDVVVEEAEVQQEDSVSDEVIQEEVTVPAVESPVENENLVSDDLTVEETGETQQNESVIAEDALTEETENIEEESTKEEEDAPDAITEAEDGIEEQIIGEEPYEMEEESSTVDEDVTTMADEENESESAEKEIEKIELISNGKLNYVPCGEDYVPAGLRYQITYSDNSKEEKKVCSSGDNYAENGDQIGIYLINSETGERTEPAYYVEEGDYAVRFYVDGMIFLETDQIIHVSSDLRAMSLPELTVGENYINAEGGGKLSWHRFTATEDGAYILNNIPSFWLYKESGKNSLGDYGAQEKINLEKGITYYFGFTGDGEYAGTLTCLADSVDIGFDFEDNPTDVCGAPGDRVVLNATAMVNQGTLLYQWYRYEDGEEYVLIPDATAPQYTATVEEEEVTYLCNVTDMFGEVHSRIIVVRPDCSITIEDDYYEQTVKPEEEVTMYVKASTNAGSLSYQWQIERREDGKYIWENIPDAIDATYTVNVESESYRCIVSNGYPEEEKTVYWFFEIESGLKITEPDDIYIEIGQDVTLTAEATTEYGKLSYQWYKVDSDINAKADEEIEGATSETYTVKNVQKSVRYYCEISNGYESDGCGCFICVNSGLKASAENDKLSVKVGETATLKVNATSNYPVTYQWYKWNKWVIGEFTKLDNATEDTYITPTMTEDEYFTCVVSDGYNEEQIDVDISVDYGFYAYAEKATVWVPKGEDAELKVNAGIYEGGGELTYEWYDAEWNQIEGENSPTCTIMNVTNLQKYRCHVQSDHGGKSVQFWVGPQEECGDYALDFSDAKTLEEAVENIAVIPVIDSKAYFKFVPDRTGIWEIYSKADEDTRAWLYDENREEIAAAYLGEAEDYEGIYDFSLKEKLEQGKVYYIATQYMHTLETGSYPVFVRYIGQAEEETHVWDEGTITQPPTCETAGVKTYECINCGETKTEEIEATGHDYPEEWTVRKAATCTETGVEYRVCHRCEKEETKEIPATGKHEMETVVDKAATCGEEGIQHEECKVCHTKEEATTIPATGKHKMETIVDKEATCGEEGSQHKECSVCHKK